jgi:NAD-dependent DNA ligase
MNGRKEFLSRQGKKPQIIFTGFKKQLRTELEKIAAANGLSVVKTVNKSLDYFVFDDNAGEVKFQTAWRQCVPMMRKEQFIELMS